MNNKQILIQNETQNSETLIINETITRDNLKEKLLDPIILPILDKRYGDIKDVIIIDEHIFKLKTYNDEIPLTVVFLGEYKGQWLSYQSIDVELCIICDNVQIGNNDYGIKQFGIDRRDSQ